MDESQARHLNAFTNIENAIANINGVTMEELAARLFPICRSITGDGVRETLSILNELVDMKVQEIPTGFHALDWTVPREWNIRDAYIKNESGERVVDFKQSNLHVLNYSVPIKGSFTLEELRPHLFTSPEYPDAIPYVTSYYEENWGFCLSQNQLDALPEGTYEVVVDSTLADGHLTLADAVLPGRSGKEILFSTYVCHPSMANNELSGPIVTAFLYRLLNEFDLWHTFRFVYAPETIGTLIYLAKNGDYLRTHMEAGYVVTCAGDAGPFTYKRSRRGETAADRVAEHCLKHMNPKYAINILDFFPGGSDERQYCSPGFNFPVGSLMRSMYGTYPEYHTSLDNLGFISAEGLAGSLEVYLRIVQVHELNKKYVNYSPYGEPHLSKHGLYPAIGARNASKGSVNRRMMHLLAFSDGNNDLVDIANIANEPAWAFAPEIEMLMKAGLLGFEDVLPLAKDPQTEGN